MADAKTRLVATARDLQHRATEALAAARDLPTIELCGQTLVAPRSDRTGEKADYDDGWNLALLSEGGPFFDVGSSVGVLSLVALALDPDRDVVLCDASHEALARAATAMVANGWGPGVRYVPGFIDREADQELEFFSAAGSAAGSRHSDHVTGAHGASRTVRTTTIDALCARTGVDPTLVKMDIEGAEIDALAGATELASRKRARFSVEVHRLPSAPMVEMAGGILAWCREVGYDAWYMREGAPLTDPGQVADRGRFHALLQPAGTPYPELLVGMAQRTSFAEAWAVVRAARASRGGPAPE